MPKRCGWVYAGGVRHLFPIGLITLMLGCAPVLRGPLDAADPESMEATLSHGYALLQGVLRDESNVTLVFGVKHGPEETEALVRRISDAAANADRAIRASAELAPSVSLGEGGLPLVEVSARNIIANQQAAGLLFAGSSFEVRLLLTQQKACEYVAALAASLEAVDENEARQDMLRGISQQFTGFEREIRTQICICQSLGSEEAR